TPGEPPLIGRLGVAFHFSERHVPRPRRDLTRAATGISKLRAAGRAQTMEHAILGQASVIAPSPELRTKITTRILTTTLRHQERHVAARRGVENGLELGPDRQH